jgi:hypothetical protein
VSLNIGSYQSHSCFALTPMDCRPFFQYGNKVVFDVELLGKKGDEIEQRGSSALQV